MCVCTMYHVWLLVEAEGPSSVFSLIVPDLKTRSLTETKALTIQVVQLAGQRASGTCLPLFLSRVC